MTAILFSEIIDEEVNPKSSLNDPDCYMNSLWPRIPSSQVRWGCMPCGASLNTCMCMCVCMCVCVYVQPCGFVFVVHLDQVLCLLFSSLITKLHVKRGIGGLAKWLTALIGTPYGQQHILGHTPSKGILIKAPLALARRKARSQVLLSLGQKALTLVVWSGSKCSCMGLISVKPSKSNPLFLLSANYSVLGDHAKPASCGYFAPLVCVFPCISE